MKKLLDILALKQVAGDFGIEIEVEGTDLPDVNSQYWVTEPDGSLRGGKEYIFKKPRMLKDVPAVLRLLQREFDKEESKLEFSFRTSVHVHMNVQECSYQQILNIIYTYLILEEPLLNFCGESRKGNRFCLRLQDAEGLLPTLNKMFSRDEGGIRDIPQDLVRYSSINIEALRKYGSLEFRALSGTMDIDRIMTWCTALYNIREFAINQKSPSDIFNLFAKVEAEAFSKHVLKQVLPHFEYPELVKDIQRSFSLSIDLPFAFASAKRESQNPCGADIVGWEAPKPMRIKLPRGEFVAVAPLDANGGWDFVQNLPIGDVA